MVRNLLPLFLVLAFGISVRCGRAQFDPMENPQRAPQAQSQKELDDYIELLRADSPQLQVGLVEAFAAYYPDSALLGIAYQYQMLAYRELNDYEATVRSGEKALQLNPDNLNTLLTLASTIPNGVTDGRRDDPRLAQAQRYALLVFQGLDKTRLPRSISPQRWQELRRNMEASAHEALGHVAVKQGNLPKAVSEFEKATEKNPNPEGSQFYRLGAAYFLTGKYDSAVPVLRRAAELGPEEIRELARSLLQKVRKKKR